MSEPFADITTKKCNNCHKEIEEPKYRLHEVACARNNIRCKLCNEMILRTDVDHHA